MQSQRYDEVMLRSVGHHTDLVKEREAARATAMALAFEEGATIADIARAADLSPSEAERIIKARFEGRERRRRSDRVSKSIPRRTIDHVLRRIDRWNAG